MTKHEKDKFIDTFMDSMKSYFLKNVDKLPENWDGFEIKHWIAEKFDDENLLSKNKTGLSNIQKSRRRDCENDILVNNL